MIPKKLFIMGKSGIGKTTLMQHLARTYPSLFFKPRLTVTRAPRVDDDANEYEYISMQEYTNMLPQEKGVDLTRGYCYRKCALQAAHGRHVLLYGSPYALESMRAHKGALLVLIEGNDVYGLTLRHGNTSCIKKRVCINQELACKFYNNPTFRMRMNLIFSNSFESNATKRTFANSIHSLLEYS